MQPIWITNFKNYESSVGQKAVDLALIHDQVAQNFPQVNIQIAVSNFDLYRTSQEVTIQCLAQSIDPIDYGSGTGKNLAQNAKNNGATGTLINHSENRMSWEDIALATALAQKANLTRIICAETPSEVAKCADLDPDFIAYEPAELIGGDKSIATENPKLIEASVEAARGIPLLVGAGVSSPADIQIAMKLGAKGFLVASAITKSSNPEKTLTGFCSAMKSSI